MTKTCETIPNLSLAKHFIKNCRATSLEEEVIVEPGAKIAHMYIRHELNVCCANTDCTRINFQKLLSGSDNKEFSLIIINF